MSIALDSCTLSSARQVSTSESSSYSSNPTMSFREPSQRFDHLHIIQSSDCEPVHKRVPNEVWEKIFSYLYPSQLSRMSMTSKNFSEIVASMEVWRRMFTVAYGSEARLRPLVSIPRFKSSYMMFMCASSLHVCERCFGLAAFNIELLYILPLPIPVLLPRRSTKEIKYVGERFDPNWTIRMCLSCRHSHVLVLEEPTTRRFSKYPMDWSTLCHAHPAARNTPGLRSIRHANATIDESQAFDRMRQYYGGDIGIQNSMESTAAYDEKTATRIRLYQLQD